LKGFEKSIGIGKEGRTGKRDWRKGRESGLKRRTRKGNGEKEGNRDWREERENGLEIRREIRFRKKDEKAFREMMWKINKCLERRKCKDIGEKGGKRDWRKGRE
jgi:hypothetical protein